MPFALTLVHGGILKLSCPNRLLAVVSLIALALGLAIPCESQSSDTVLMASPSERERVQRVEAGIAPLEIEGQEPIRLTLEQWMEKLNIPGLSVAVFDHGKIVWKKTYGVKEAGKKDPVTLDTLFQAGSISKPVMAMAVLHYVQQGKFNLDENVNDKLISWKVPDNDFTKEQKVNLRRLLSHSAGTTVHGFPGYEVGEKLPTLVQVLNGEPPSKTAPVRVDMVPGTKFRYSGGGTTIVQLMLVDQLKKPFPEIMRDTVIAPLGLKNSTYEQPLPGDRAAKAASGHGADGKAIEGKWHVYPEMAAAGLWTTASDLAEVALEVAESKAGKSNRVLTQDMTKQMLTVQAEPAGLGFMVDPKSDQFGHGGADEGFQADMTAFSDSRSGVVVMANSDMGMLLFARIEKSIANEYGWTSYQRGPEPTSLKVLLAAKLRGVPQAIALYNAMRAEGPAKDFTPADLNTAGYMLLSGGDQQAAIRLFAENVRIYPEDANAYDSLAEAYMKAGQKESAIENYENSLKLDPKNENAAKMLKKLGVEWKPPTE